MAQITPPKVEGRIRVRDGRKLGFAEFGPPDGRPILWLHGTPGARRQIPEDARLAADEVGVRFVGVDRPGTGLSTSHLYGALVEFVGDLEILLDELGFEELAVIGLSGGGPYALAAGCGMPDRVKAVGVLGGVAPTRGPDAVSGGLVSLAVRFAPLLPPFRVPLGLLLGAVVMAFQPVGHPALDLYARVSPPGDREVFARPEIKEMFLNDLTETGGRLRAPIDDAILFTRDWGFQLADVSVPVKWWHGDADHIVPLSHGRQCVDRLPDAELFARPGESHLGGFGAAAEVLETVLAAWDGESVKETAV
ncbi:MAG: alpha/beta hydrolase [Acidimicrobiia bacterium]|nr:alpha/beta hydrolase [Acidimicrobiia bacterium]